MLYLLSVDCDVVKRCSLFLKLLTIIGKILLRIFGSIEIKP